MNQHSTTVDYITNRTRRFGVPTFCNVVRTFLFSAKWAKTQEVGGQSGLRTANNRGELLITASLRPMLPPQLEPLLKWSCQSGIDSSDLLSPLLPFIYSALSDSSNAMGFNDGGVALWSRRRFVLTLGILRTQSTKIFAFWNQGKTFCDNVCFGYPYPSLSIHNW